jgi:hypothetical protein
MEAYREKRAVVPEADFLDQSYLWLDWLPNCRRVVYVYSSSDVRAAVLQK